MNKRGFSLLEILVAVAVFMIFVIGIYSGIQFVLKVVYQSRLRIIETGILNEEIETIRNLAFSDVGIVNGSPLGVLERVVTTTRNGIDFTITRTIRSIDDPFDGTIGGNPNDTAPADYKKAHVEVVCTSCGQQSPLSMVTRVAPRYLEGNVNNGALFVQVFDANAQAVQGANVRVFATSTATTTIDIVDTTDNSGMLRLVDLPSGIGAYRIWVTKSGYVPDQTRTTSVSLPNPVKPHASVVAQDVTSISFSIDRVSELQIQTKNASCQAVGTVSVDVAGTQLIGTNPNTYLVSTTLATDSGGNHNMQQLHWDAYGLRPQGYDLIGSIPALPLTIAPNVIQPIELILGPNTSRSLLVNVADSVTRLPVSDATVLVTSTGYSQSLQTGVGFISQTDWSGGSGQQTMVDPTQYDTDDGNLTINNPIGDVTLRLVGQNYVTAGELESSIYDLGVAANFVNLSFNPLSQPPATGTSSLRFRLASSSTSTPSSWTYYGPDGTTSTYYTETTPSIHSVHNGDQFIRYKAFLSTASTTYTPTLSDVAVSYTTSCTPPGQSYFGSLSNQTYSVTVTKNGYQQHNEQVTVSNDVSLAVDLVASP